MGQSGGVMQPARPSNFAAGLGQSQDKGLGSTWKNVQGVNINLDSLTQRSGPSNFAPTLNQLQSQRSQGSEFDVLAI